MAKNIKLNIKNSQISKALDLKKIKSSLAKKKGSKAEEEKPQEEAKPKTKAPSEKVADAAPKRRVKARTQSAFHDPSPSEKVADEPQTEKVPEKTSIPPHDEAHSDTQDKLKKTIETTSKQKAQPSSPKASLTPKTKSSFTSSEKKSTLEKPKSKAQPKLGPTGRHINDLLQKENTSETESKSPPSPDAPKAKLKEYKDFASLDKEGSTGNFKSFKDPSAKKKKISSPKSFDSRDRLGLRSQDDSENSWRKKRPKTKIKKEEQTTIRPQSLSIRLPISIKDLAGQMKLKASELLAKLLMQGMVLTLNDYLDDETTVQLLGHEFQCEISIDTTEEDRIRITDKSVKEEIELCEGSEVQLRPPIVTFMGHVDHGKTSLIDAIRQSNIAAGEAGAITQHVGAFNVSTPQGNICILDTPGHEAFSAMRARGANLTDIVVLVIAGDEGMKPQTEEAISHAKAANVPMIVAINKSDKSAYNPENVYRQLADQDLLPEAWGGQVITINCSAHSKEGLKELVEMLALQAEILELKANPNTRARGVVIESQMHKGYGVTATLVVQNGSLKPGDAVVFNHHWGRVKNLYNENFQLLESAGPSRPCKITGLSGLPEAGDDFIVVSNEKEAKDIAETRQEDSRQHQLKMAKKPPTLESLLQNSEEEGKKTLNLILRADVQGTLEALKNSLLKIKSDKIDLQIIFQGVGDISESDLHLAAASKALIIGFHSQVETRAESLIKPLGVQVKLHKIIYEAIDDIKVCMVDRLDKVTHEDLQGSVEIKAVFKASQLGKIAGCQVKEGSIKRSHKVKLYRGDEIIWKGNIASLKRERDDVKEVQKGMECGVVLDGFHQFEVGDIIQPYEFRYETQEL